MKPAISSLKSESALPPGWRWVRLDDLCERRTGIRDPREQPDTPFRYVDISSVDNLRKRIGEVKTVLGKDAPSRARQIIRSGDVLVATTRPNLNAVALIPPELDGQICSTGFCVLRPGIELLSDYLFAFVQHPAFVRRLTDMVKGALYPAVTDGQVRSLHIPLPPLAEQRRIVAILNEQMAAVEKARAAAAEQVEAVQAFCFACIRESLTDEASQHRKLADCLIEVADGIGADWARFPVLGATRAGLAPAKEPVGKRPERYKFVGVGTVFYNPMRILIRSIAMVDEHDPPGITSPDYVVVKPRPGVLHFRWFYYWLRSPFGERFIKSLARGAVRERMLFRRLASGVATLPSWSRQCIVADRLKAAQELYRKTREQLEQLDRLPVALLRAGFNGEL